MADDDSTVQKQCTTCGETKPLSAFGKARGRQHGVKGSCKECHNASNRSTRAKYIDRYRAIEAAWRRRNPERMRQRTKAWQLANPERYRSLQANWRAKRRKAPQLL